MSSQFKFGRHYDFQELLADGIVHAIGVLLALIGTAVLIFQASAWGSTGAQLAAWVYGLGLVGALAVAVPTIRASREKMIEISGHLLRYAEEATTALGGTFPKGFRPVPPDWHDAAGSRQAADIKE